MLRMDIYGLKKSELFRKFNYFCQFLQTKLLKLLIKDKLFIVKRKFQEITVQILIF